VSTFLLDEEAQSAPLDSSESGWFRNPKIIFVLVASLIFGGSTIATNFTISSGKIEYGQGLFTVRACDTWISIGLYPTAAQYNGLSRVDAMELVGLDPIKCANKFLRFQFFDSSSATALPMYVGVVRTDTTTATAETGTATIVTVFDTSTAYSGNKPESYTAFARRALTLVNEAKVNVGYDDGYLRISYNASTGSWKIAFAQPLATMPSISRITVESAPFVA
jgi:hypothetical protein